MTDKWVGRVGTATRAVGPPATLRVCRTCVGPLCPPGQLEQEGPCSRAGVSQYARDFLSPTSSAWARAGPVVSKDVLT